MSDGQPTTYFDMSMSMDRIVKSMDTNCAKGAESVIPAANVVIMAQAAIMQKEATERAAHTAATTSKSLSWATWALVFCTAVLAVATVVQIYFTITAKN